MGKRITILAILLLLVGTPSIADQGVIGVVGCSNTGQHAYAYHQQSTEHTLTQPRSIGGGTPWAWMTRNGENRYFDEYETLKPAGGYSQVWVQVCMREREHNGVFDQPERDIITALVAEIRERDPQASIVMSPLNYYTTDSCLSVGGTAGQQVTVDTVDWAVANLGVTRGPDTGPLAPDMLRTDGCHIDGTGFDLVGGQMVDWFDGTPPPTTTTTSEPPPTTTTTTVAPLPDKCDRYPTHPRCLRNWEWGDRHHD